MNRVADHITKHYLVAEYILFTDKGKGVQRDRLSLTSFPVMERQKTKSCRLQCTAVIGMRITVQKYPMNIREPKNDRCGGLNHWAKHSDF